MLLDQGNNIELIRVRMEERGIDEKALAHASGVHLSLIKRYFNGYSRIGVKNALPVADALGLTVREVLYGDGKKAA